MRNLVAVTFSLFLFSESAYAQKDNFLIRYWNGLVNDTSDISKPQFLIYPTLAYAPETSWEFGLSSLLVYYAHQDTTNRLSEINGFAFYTLENQYGIWIDHALYSDQNKWYFLGRLRYQSFPLLYFGIGPESPSEYLARVDGNQISLKERVMRKIYPNLFFGIEVDYRSLHNVDFVQAVSEEPIQRPIGSNGSNNLGFGLGIIYDNRHNVLNARDAFFSEVAFLRYDDAWGSDFSFTSILADFRIYRPMQKNNVLAAQLLGQFNSGNVPFNQMALLGGENIMRGYYTGRYRDNNQLNFQVEYRFLPIPFSFTDRIGAAVFAGTGKVFDDVSNFRLNNLVVAGGAGLRFLLFPKKDIYTRLDLAFTSEGPGFYIFIGEAF